MASIGRWLYRLFSICLPCLKSAETDEKESEDCPPGLNPVENNKGEINPLEDEYPEYLNPFASGEDEGNENLNGKTGKEQHETEYPDSINPFSSEDEENKREIDYPEELNPFADEKENQREIDYPEELNPFAHEEDKEANSAIVNQCSLALDHTPPVTNGSSSTFQLPNEEKSNAHEDESEQQGDEYPESLNPFASEDEEDDYPDELNPFADEKDDEADSALVNQSGATLSNELTAPPSNGSSSKFPLPYQEKSDDGKNETKSDESDQQGGEYPDILNPFASEDEADDYPEALNPFALEDEGPLPQSSSETSCHVPSIYKDNEYDEALNPFASEDEENNDSIAKNPSITVDPQQTAAAVNGSTLLVPLTNERKGKSTKKYRSPDPPMTMRIIPSESAPGVNESSPGVNESAPGVNKLSPGVNESSPRVNESAPGDSRTSGHVPLTVKVVDYDEALNHFASEDEEVTGDTTGNLPSSPAQPCASSAYSCTTSNVPLKKVKKGKSLKKRRAPEPPVLESTNEGSATSDIGSNQPCASSSNPGTKKT